jgi:hypothetical protein
MIHHSSELRLRPAGRLLLTLMVGAALTSCSWMGRGGACREPAVPTDSVNLPPLRPAPGLDAPDTRNAIRVPELTEPERPRGSTDSCLSRPPSYGS